MSNVMEWLTVVYEWLQQWWWLLAVGAGLGLYYIYEREKFIAEVIELMLLMEKKALEMAKAGLELTGPDKMAEVVNNILATLPWWVKTVLSILATLRGKTLDELITEFCQTIYDAAKAKLDELLEDLE